ncbi:MAG: cupin domain-containing protein [Melioribacteraceae bacterium]|nr:cupin domain-containing protein [Melioribacteraceae bacterium]MCF8265137.1 cupin domain-containing protein [Melioribacteraceae bacterium]
MKYESEIFNIADDMEWESVAPGMKRKILGYNDEIMLVKVHFDKGGIGVRHKHRHSQTTYVESGKFEVTVGENTKILKGGDGFYIPPNIEHGAVCLEDGILIDVFSPIREDFMEN